VKSAGFKLLQKAGAGASHQDFSAAFNANAAANFVTTDDCVVVRAFCEVIGDLFLVQRPNANLFPPSAATSEEPG